MRRAIAVPLALLLSLPAGGSVLVILASPPLSGMLPPAFEAWLRPAADAVFRIVAGIAPESLPGRVFYGSFAPLPALFGPGALAVHAALWGLPWAALALVIGLAGRRRGRAGGQALAD
ncbi:MAG: hypothetical protein LC624_11490 [Halobacteriales archaeon]|nr:hypothetical protein [Halobacteriales archaeon]